MAYTGNMESALKSNNSSSPNVSFKTKTTATRLKSEYGLMNELLTRVKTQVENLLTNSHSSERRPLQDANSQQNQSLRLVENQELRRQLEKAALDLKGIQTENGREHRYLKTLQDELRREDEKGVYNEDLYLIVTELTNEHQRNCLLKKQVQTMIESAKQEASRSSTSLKTVVNPDDDFSFFSHSYNLN